MADKDLLERLEATIGARRNADAATSYVAALHAKGLDEILKKVGEEAFETVIASKSGDRRQVIHETADLWFHCLVLLSHHGVKVAEVLQELERREGRSGVEEKSSRGRESSKPGGKAP
jgi:phosphoribosyl-ATP pyrophosphohydrolase